MDADRERDGDGETRLPADGDYRVAYSSAEVARFFGVSVATIERAIKAGFLPSFKIRDRRLIPRQAVEDILTRAYDNQG